MFEHRSTTVAAVAAISLAPGVLRWWWGRMLARQAEDPALPERLMEAERRGTLVFILALAAIAMVSPPALGWGLPLVLLAQLIGLYPLRKVLFEETWSLPAYVWFFTRLLVAAFGFWIVLMLMPILALAARGTEFVVASALAAVLVAWNHGGAEFLRFALRAEPVADPALLARFTALGAASRVRSVRFEQIRLGGGAIANAAALASVQRPTVLFSETLLARLDADEAAAICAHELAHLEYFDARRLRRMYAANLGLIILGAAVAPATRLAGVSSTVLPTIAWLALFAAAVVLRARNRQRNETASDLRALELTGDADALVRGLTKLYTFARVPRRFDADHERHATHPSLARRIRDIRQAAGAAPAPVEHASFTSTDGRTAVAFHDDRVHWSEGEAVTHSLSYAHLSELRLRAAYSGPTALVAVEKSGRRWSMPIAGADVARIQAALDAVDGRLPDPAATQPIPPALSRALLAVAGLLGLLAGQAAMLVVALFAAAQPASPLLAAAGAGALAAAALMLRDGPFGAGSTALAAACLAIFGGVLLAVAIGRRREEAARRTVVFIVALGIFTTAAVLVIAFNGFNPVRLHQSARSVTSATVLLLALGGSFACCRARSLQYASIGVLLAGVGTAAAGSPAFLDRFGTDPFIGPSHPIAWRMVSQPPTVEFPIPFYVAALHVSNGGTLVALEPVTHGGVTNLRTFHVGRPGGTLAPLAASDLLFTDEGHALLLDSREGHVELRLVALGSGSSEIWRQRVPDIFEATLSFRNTSGRWRLVGHDSKGRIVRAEGRPGRDRIDVTRWPAPESVHGWIETIATSGASALAVETRPEPGSLQPTTLVPWAMLIGRPGLQSHVWTIGRTPRTTGAFSRLTVGCAQDALGPGDERLVCAAFDGTRTRFVALDPADGRVTPLAWLRGAFMQHGASGDGWLAGWADRSLVVLQLARREALRFPQSEVVTHARGTQRVLATASYRAGTGTLLRIYAAEDLK